MYRVRLWSVRRSRQMEWLYNTFNPLVVKMLRGVVKVFGTKLDKPITAVEAAAKGFFFDCKMCGECALSKTGMSSTPGTLLRILEVLEKHSINVEYVPSGIDIISLVVSSAKTAGSLYTVLGELQKAVKPDNIKVTEHMAIVAAVGRRMAYQPGVSGKIFAKLGESGVNIRMITQGPEELNIIVGVEEKDFQQAIRVLYNSFVKEN